MISDMESVQVPSFALNDTGGGTDDHGSCTGTFAASDSVVKAIGSSVPLLARFGSDIFFRRTRLVCGRRARVLLVSEARVLSIATAQGVPAAHQFCVHLCRAEVTAASGGPLSLDDGSARVDVARRSGSERGRPKKPFACFQVVSSRLSRTADATTTNFLTASFPPAC